MDPRRERQNDVGHSGPMGRTLLPGIGPGPGTIGAEDAALNRIKLLTALTGPLLEQGALDTRIKHTDRNPFARSPRIMQQALGRQQGEDFLEHIAHSGLGEPAGVNPGGETSPYSGG